MGGWCVPVPRKSLATPRGSLGLCWTQGGLGLRGGSPTLGRRAGEQILGGGPGPSRRTSELPVPAESHACAPLLWAWPRPSL